ncbi:MAG: ECF RNA polymerase sigma factor SigK [Sporichthyaceae bacterium]
MPVERLESLLTAVAKGDQAAFEKVYDRLSAPVYGLVRRVLRDPAQSEEVAQEVLLAVWRHAARFDETQGSGMAWVMTMAHRRAVDRVRSVQASTDREHRLAVRDVEPAYDSVAESVQTTLEREAVRKCLASLTELQREAVTLAYYTGRSYREVAEHLDLPLGTVKTRMRDGLIRLRDCLGATA